MKLAVTIFLSLFFGLQVFAQTVTISGYITDKKNGETLTGATIFVKDKKEFSTSSNEFGFYSLTLPKGSYELVISFVGYQEEIIAINIANQNKINIALTDNSKILDAVVVTSGKGNKNVTQPQMGVEKLSVATISKLPVLFGEKSILNPAATARCKVGRGRAKRFYRRGGTIDQTLILLDDAPVYNASHLLGFFSTFNSDAIKDVTLYKGTAPAEFGGRVASVVDVKMNEGNNQDYGVSGGIGLISSKLNIEGPIQKVSLHSLLPAEGLMRICS